MIRLSTLEIQFTPRVGFKRTHPAFAQELVYGHVCNTCGNLIQALFYTPEEVSLWPYEETTVLSQGQKNMGEILKVVPDDKFQEGESCYRSHFYSPADGRKGQHIVLKNHVLRPSRMDNGDRTDNSSLWEVGERTCPLTGVFSLKADLAIKDLCHFVGIEDEVMNTTSFPPTIEEFVPQNGDANSRYNIKWTPAFGQAPPMLLISREMVNASHNYWVRLALKPFKKPDSKETT